MRAHPGPVRCHDPGEEASGRRGESPLHRRRRPDACQPDRLRIDEPADPAAVLGLSMGALDAVSHSKDMLPPMILGRWSARWRRCWPGCPRCWPRIRLGGVRCLLESHLDLNPSTHPWFVFAYMEAEGLSRRRAAILAIASERRPSCCRRARRPTASGAGPPRPTLQTARLHQAAVAGLVRQACEALLPGHHAGNVTSSRVTAFVESAIGLRQLEVGSDTGETARNRPVQSLVGLLQLWREFLHRRW